MHDSLCGSSPSITASPDFRLRRQRLRWLSVKAINEIVVKSSVAMGLEVDKKLRIDTTFMETVIHHPTDSTPCSGQAYKSLHGWLGKRIYANSNLFA